MRADRYRLSKWNTVDRMAVIIENWPETDSRSESRRILAFQRSVFSSLVFRSSAETIAIASLLFLPFPLFTPPLSDKKTFSSSLFHSSILVPLLSTFLGRLSYQQCVEGSAMDPNRFDSRVSNTGDEKET